MRKEWDTTEHTFTPFSEKEGFEVTTYRIDGKYEDSRHPSEVTFTPNLEEDLKRREFDIDKKIDRCYNLNNGKGSRYRLNKEFGQNPKRACRRK